MGFLLLKANLQSINWSSLAERDLEESFGGTKNPPLPVILFFNYSII